MEFTIKSGNIVKLRSACVVIGVNEVRQLTPTAQQLDRISRNYITTMLKRADFRGKVGQTLLLHHVPRTACERILVIGCGPEKDLGDSTFHKIVNRMAITLNDAGIKEAISCLSELAVKGRDLHWKIRQTVEVVLQPPVP